jgi:hypothetical protein
LSPARVKAVAVEADDRKRDEDSDESPETPLDEPRPPRVEDPPSDPDDKGPYVVRGRRLQPADGKTEA